MAVYYKPFISKARRLYYHNKGNRHT